MSPTEFALLSLVAWTLLLLLSLGTLRTTLVINGAKAPNSFSPAGDDISAFGKRLTRAHANSYENLPISAAVLLFAIATGSTAATDGLAYLFVGARIAQSIAHLISTSNLFVRIRFGFFVVQNVILVVWLLRLFQII